MGRTLPSPTQTGAGKSDPPSDFREQTDLLIAQLPGMPGMPHTPPPPTRPALRGASGKRGPPPAPPGGRVTCLAAGRVPRTWRRLLGPPRRRARALYFRFRGKPPEARVPEGAAAGELGVSPTSGPPCWCGLGARPSPARVVTEDRAPRARRDLDAEWPPHPALTGPAPWAPPRCARPAAGFALPGFPGTARLAPASGGQPRPSRSGRPVRCARCHIDE